MQFLLTISLIAWIVCMIIPQEASFLRKHNLSDPRSLRFFYFRFELRRFREKLADENLKKELGRKITIKLIGTIFGLVFIQAYVVLLLAKHIFYIDLLTLNF